MRWIFQHQEEPNTVEGSIMSESEQFALNRAEDIRMANEANDRINEQMISNDKRWWFTYERQNR